MLVVSLLYLRIKVEFVKSILSDILITG